MMNTFKRDCVIETMIEVPFKALCPIPDPPRPYHGVMRLRYYSNHVLDFNEVADKVLSYTCTARSVEDIAEYGVRLVKGEIGKRDSNLIVTCEVEIPQQEGWSHVGIPQQKGHLHVIVSVDGLDSL